MQRYLGSLGGSNMWNSIWDNISREKEEVEERKAEKDNQQFKDEGIKCSKM